MAIEIFGPRIGAKGTVGGSDSADLEYILRGTNDPLEVISYLEANITDYLDLVCVTYNYENIGFELWKISIPFAPSKPQTRPQIQRPVGSRKITYDATGGTQNVKQSLETISQQQSSMKTTDPSVFGKSIGVQKDGTVQGVDIYVPNSTISIEYNCPNSTANQAYFDLVESLIGCTNNEAFTIDDEKIFVNKAVGEVLFIGFTASQRTEDDLSLSFKYLAGKNVTGMTIGEVFGGGGPDFTVNKKAWEYFWIVYQEMGNDGNRTTIPWEVFVERVYNGGALLSVLP